MRQKIGKTDLSLDTPPEHHHTPPVQAKIPFRAILSAYTSKNNVHFVLTDVTRAVIYEKATGGQYTKRGTEKNRAKCVLSALDQISSAIGTHGMDALSAFVIKAHGNMASAAVTKMVVKELSTRNWGLEHPVAIYNGTPRKEGKPPRPSGGRRGRRV